MSPSAAIFVISFWTSCLMASQTAVRPPAMIGGIAAEDVPKLMNAISSAMKTEITVMITEMRTVSLAYWTSRAVLSHAAPSDVVTCCSALEAGVGSEAERVPVLRERVGVLTVPGRRDVDGGAVGLIDGSAERVGDLVPLVGEVPEVVFVPLGPGFARADEADRVPYPLVFAEVRLPNRHPSGLPTASSPPRRGASPLTETV